MKRTIQVPGVLGNLMAEFLIWKWLSRKGYCCEAMSVEQTAREIGIDRDLLNWYCISHHGMNFTKWRKELRIKEAKRIMKKLPGMPHSILARKVGIPDRSNFRKQFKEVTGLHPLEWAERYAGRDKK